PRPRDAGVPDPAARPPLHEELTMPRDAPKPALFESAWLQRSLDRHYTWGLVFMVVLILGFVIYGIQEPTPRARAAREQQATYAHLGEGLFANNCASCHGRAATGGSAPTLNSKQFLTSTSDEQAPLLIPGGVPGPPKAGREPRLRRSAHRRADPPARRLPPLVAAQRAQRPELATRQTLSRSGSSFAMDDSTPLAGSGVLMLMRSVQPGGSGQPCRWQGCCE